jgi:Na+-translocating ferredoxin:NAD+ oxidoreductase subunit D
MSHAPATPAEAALKRPVIASSPHLHGRWSSTALMWTVSASLLPCVIAGWIGFGPRVLALLLVTVAGAAGCEAAIQRWRRQELQLGDGSAVLTGLLLALTLPPAFPLAGAFLGGVVAIGLGKAVFGGLGMNIFNPALVGRAFLQAAFPVAMTTWSAHRLVDAVSTATPLALVKFREPEQTLAEVMPALRDLLIGTTGGSVGETSALAVLAGGGLLLILGVANWRIPLSMGLAAVIFGGLFWLADPGAWPHPLFHLLTGGFLFGALFMATDLVTSPLTAKGMWIFGAGCGLLTVLIRLVGGLPEGVMFSILLMNATVPLINRWTRPRVFGA